MLKRCLSTILAVTTVAALTTPFGAARAGVSRWTRHGPPGADVNAVAVAPSDPQTIYAGTTGAGMFKSTDGGSQWRRRTSGLASGFTSVLDIAVHPDNADIAYASAFPGLYKTTNGGRSWTHKRPGNGRAVALNPLKPNVVYGAFQQGVFKSTNGGTNWTTQPILAQDIKQLLVDPKNPNNVYAINDLTVQKSENAGKDWTAVHAGLPAGFSLTSIAINPKNPNTLLLGTSGDGLFKTTDGAGDWDPVTTSPAMNTVREIGIDPFAPKRVYVYGSMGLVASEDGGVTFDPETSQFQFPDDIDIHPTNHTVYVGDGIGIHKSTDMGASWKVKINGLLSAVVNELIVTHDGKRLYSASGTSGIAVSTNGGLSWKLRNNGLAFLNVSALGAAPTDGDIMYAGVAGTGVAAYTSVDGGKTWVSSSSGLPSMNGDAIAVDPSIPTHALIGGWSPAGIDAHYTTNGGTSWQASAGLPTTTMVNSLAFDPVDGSFAYAGTEDGFYRSANSGVNWASPTLTSTDVHSIAVDPVDSEFVYAGTEIGIFKSDDRGLTWDAVPQDLTSQGFIYAIAIDPQRPNHVYAAAGSGVYRSTNAGEDWEPFDAEGMFFGTIRGLVVQPSFGTTLHAGIVYESVFDYLLHPAITKPKSLFQTATRFGVGWAAPPGHGVDAFDVRYRRAPFNGILGTNRTFRSDTERRSAVFEGTLGSTYCFGARARDGSRKTEFGPTNSCTSIPVDDRTLTDAGDEWDRKKGAGYFRGTRTTSSLQGAELQLEIENAHTLSIVATKCPNCGVVSVFVDADLLDVIDLSSPTTKKRRVIKVYDSATELTGTFRVFIVTSGEPVHMDGVGTSPV